MERIILTGASDGLGKAFGELCVKNDIKIIALCRTKPEYECEFIKVDLSNELEKTTGNKIENPNEWMQPSDIAELMLYFLNLPKKIEISEITINRKNIEKK